MCPKASSTSSLARMRLAIDSSRRSWASVSGIGTSVLAWKLNLGCRPAVPELQRCAKDDRFAASPRSRRAMSAIADALVPTGRLRVAVWTVRYFAGEKGSVLAGIVPDLGAEFARRIGVPAAFLRCATPGALIEAFRSGVADVSFVGVTAGRA